MARGRMLSREISLDEKVNALPDDSARLLFTWLIPHLDCEGRTYGEAQVIKAMVIPRLNWSSKRVEKYLTEMEKLGLIARYCLNGNRYLLAPNFEKHQTGLRKDRESQSKIPSPPQELLWSNDGNSPAQVKVKVKDKDDEDKGLTDFLDFLTTDLIKGRLTPHIHRKAMEIYESCPPGRALEAAKVAVEKGGKSLSYLETVIKNWGKPKPEKPHHLKNYRGRSPADKNIPRKWPGQDKESGLIKRGISPVTGKAIGSGFNTF